MNKVTITASNHYDKLYTKKQNVFGVLPMPIVKRAVKYMTKRVLDVGAGEGRNAIYLAKKFDVLAVDISKVGLERIKQAGVKTQLGDARKVSGRFDAVINTFMLHHLARKEALKTTKQLQTITTKGGIHVIAAFTQEGDFYKKSMFYLKKNELKEIYVGWKILEYSTKRVKVHQKKEDGSPMCNQVAYMIAQKI